MIPVGCSINIYADDTELHASAYNLETLSDVIQQDLERIGEWLSSNIVPV